MSSSWIGDAQQHAVDVLSAAAQAPDANALAVLEGIPEGAWGCSPEIADLARMLTVAIKGGIAESSAAFVLAEIGTEADPWRLSEYANNFTSLWKAFYVSTRTLPRDPLLDLVEGADDEQEQQQAPAMPPFTDFSDVYNIADMQVPYLFEDKIPMGEVSVVASEPGVGKTTMVIGLGLSTALNRTMLSGFVPQRRGRVAMLLAEDGPIPTAQRLRGWCEAAGLDQCELQAAFADGWLSVLCGESAALLDFTDGTCRRTRAYAELLEKCRTEQYDMLVVDSMIEWVGTPNENDNGAVQTASKALIDLARASGGAVVTLHHTNKVADKSGTIGLHSIRGAGSLAGKIRWGALLTHLGDDEAKRFDIDPRDRWRYLRFDVVKSQYAARPGVPVYLERGEGGIPRVVNLHPPSEKDSLLPLARMLADRIGDNEADMPKWALLREKPGTQFRAEVKIHYGDKATVRNICLAYDVAVERGLIVEESGDDDAHGQAPTIPRKASTNVVVFGR